MTEFIEYRGGLGPTGRVREGHVFSSGSSPALLKSPRQPSWIFSEPRYVAVVVAPDANGA